MLQNLKNSLNNKNQKQAIPKEVNHDALDFETSIAYLAHESEKRAWRVAIIACLLAFVLGVAIFLLTPLKTAVPYVIRYDSTTGHTDIITGATEQNIDINEAVSKYFVSRYINLREGYYYETLQEDYNLVQIFSSQSVSDEYRLLYDGQNSRYVKNGAKVIEKIEIVSVVLGQAAELATATARIKILTYDKSNAQKLPVEKNKVITLTFKYTPEIKMNEFQRLNNPLGFQVISYRVDNEITR